MNLDSLAEQLQEDAITMCQGILEDSELDALCDLIIKRVRELKNKGGDVHVI